MSRRSKIIFIVVVAAFLTGWVCLWALPLLVEAIPGQYRQYIPGELLALVTAPLPEALPAPAVAGAGLPRVTIPTLAATAAVPTPTPTPPATATSPALAEAVTATASPVPTQTAVPTPTATTTPIPPPPAARIEGVRVIPQKFNNCGPTNLTMNLNFYGFNVDQLDVAAVIRPNYEDRNVSPWELRDYVLTQTPLQAAVFSGGDVLLLKRLVAAGFPVVIEKGYEPDASQGWMGHYLTVIGYDDAEQVFITMDSFLGPWDSSGRRERYDEVVRQWEHFNYVLYVVYRPEQEAALHQILGPDLLDPLTMWQNAALRAQTAIEADPINAFAWFNLGTNLTNLGDLSGEAVFYENAAAAFDQARSLGLPPRMLWYQFSPYSAYLGVGRYTDVLTLAEATLITQGGRSVEETYFYQGQALSAMGDEEDAKAAYERAVQLNPNFALAQQAVDAME